MNRKPKQNPVQKGHPTNTVAQVPQPSNHGQNRKIQMSTFKVTPIVAARPAGTGKESKDAKEARAKALFSSKKVSFFGRLEDAALKALANGDELEIETNKVSAAKPGILACEICHLVHDLKQPHLSGLISFYKVVATNRIFTLSDTCRQKYVDGAPQNLSNPADYRTVYPAVTK